MATIFGTAGDDLIQPGLQSAGVTGVEDQTFSGGVTIEGGGGNDSISGGPGNDLVDGGSGDDVLTASNGTDTLLGGSGDDTVQVFVGSSVSGTIDGGDGVDVLYSVAGPIAGLNVTDVELFVFLGLISIGLDTLDPFRTLRPIASGFGEARLQALEAGEYDFARFEFGPAVSSSNLSFFGSAGDDTIKGSANDDLLYGAPLSGSGFVDSNRIAGRGGDDGIIGAGGNDTLAGGTGDDSVLGDFGDDLIRAGAGNDQLTGGFGDDTLRGGGGDDTLSGQDAADTFVFARANRGGHDVITDFQNDLDQLRLIGFGFTTAADVIATATTTTVDGIIGTLITLPEFPAGTPASVFLQNFALENLDAADIVLG